MPTEQPREGALHNFLDIARKNVHQNNFRVIGEDVAGTVDGGGPDTFGDPDDDLHVCLLLTLAMHKLASRACSCCCRHPRRRQPAVSARHWT